MAKYLSSSRRPENIVRFLLYLCLTLIVVFGFITIVLAGRSSESSPIRSKAVVLNETTVNGQVMSSHYTGAATYLLLLADERAGIWDTSTWDNANWGS